jgi:hypothetical protein
MLTRTVRPSTMAKVILDANVVIGHLDDQDSLHDRAEALAERIRANGDTLQVIDLTLQEAISVLCRRTTQRKQNPPNLPPILQRVRVWLERGLVGIRCPVSCPGFRVFKLPKPKVTGATRGRRSPTAGRPRVARQPPTSHHSANAGQPFAPGLVQRPIVQQENNRLLHFAANFTPLHFVARFRPGTWVTTRRVANRAHGLRSSTSGLETAQVSQTRNPNERPFQK